MEIKLTTYKDVIDRLIDFLGANVSAEAQRDARRAALTAMRDLTAEHRWVYFYQLGRLTTVPPQSTGTVTYDHEGGVAPRILTLTGAIWPSWAGFASVVISNVEYEAVTRISDTVLQLKETSNPGVDLTAATAYILFRDTYPLPGDFLAMDQLVEMQTYRNLEFLRPGEWLSWKSPSRGPANPYAYTTTAAPGYFGALALRLFPAPDAIYNLDYIYQRRPRPLQIEQHSEGVVTLGASTLTVTGLGTKWDRRHIGACIRFSSDGLNLPTGPEGAYPAFVERVIADVVSPVSLTLDAVPGETLGSVKYVISDPVDLEEGAMLTAFFRGAEAQIARSRNMKDRSEHFAAYRQAVIMAREADARNFDHRAGGQRRRRWLRLSEMPRGPDVS